MTEALRDQLQSALGGVLTLERELGGGGMSRVFVARDEALGREVVIKVLSPELSATLSVERFTREIKLAAALQEPHIVPVLAAGQTAEGLPWYTMPFVRGDSLRARLTAGRVPMAEAVGILRNVMQALAYAHAQGIVHRDIKPDNVLLSSGTAVVTDFGIAKALELSKTAAPGGTLTGVGTSLGTPGYMAPEQATGDDVDGRADLYAWGVMAYELLSGSHPFSDKTTAQQLIAAHIAEPPRDLNERLAADARREPAARALSAVVMQCLQKSPNDRPAGATEVLTLLDGAATPGGTAHATPAASRSRAMMMALGAVAVVAIAAFALSRRNRADISMPLLEPKRVVVATFENKTGDATLDYGAMAADWIARGLANTGIVDVGGTSADLAARGAATSSVSYAEALLTLAREAKAGIVVSGAYYPQGDDSVWFQADFTDANAGKLIQSVGPIAASKASVTEGIERLLERVIGGLAPLVDSTLAGMASKTSRPPNFDAYREFLAGEDLFYRDEEAAVAHFSRAAALDTAYQYPLLRVISLFDNMEELRARDSVTRIVKTRRNLLTPYEQAYFDFVSDGTQNVTAAREMVKLAPKSQFAAYILGICLRDSRRAREADSVFASLDPESGGLRGRVYFYDHRTAVLHMLGEHDRALDIARRGMKQYPGRFALARLELAELAALGRVEELDAAVTRVLAMRGELRFRPGPVVASTVRELRAHGRADAASALSARLLAWLSARTTQQRDSLDGRQDRVAVLVAARQWNELQPLADSLAMERPAALVPLAWRGVTMAMRGQREGALAVDRQLSARDHKYETGDEIEMRATLAAALDDKARVVEIMQLDVNELDLTHRALLGELLRDYPPFKELFRPKG